MNENVLDILLSSIDTIKIDENSYYQPRITESREEQYARIFGHQNEILTYLKDTSYHKIVEKTLHNYFEEIFNSNPEIENYRNLISIVPVEADKHATTAFRTKNKTVIVFDVFTMKFLWMMNKANYYGTVHSNESAYNIFYDVLMHFGSIANRKLFGGKTLPKPNTPTHKDIASMNLIGMAIQTQEKFLLAHEIAHLIIDQKLELSKENDFHIAEHLIPLIKSTTNQSNLEIELAADKLAFHLVANTLDLSNQIMLEFYCNNIFLIIRYMLWSNIAFHIDEKENTSANIWLARNGQIRTIINDFCRERGGAMFIIDTLEHLEATLELAALETNEKLKWILKNEIKATNNV